MIWVSRFIAIDDSEIVFEFLRSSGPGGQNVNKVATAVRLRFDVRRSSSLPIEVRERLIRLAGKRVGEDGILAIVARRHRTQEANRRDAVERLVGLVRRAAEKRRLEAKKLRGRRKTTRGAIRHVDE
ncbi:MAG TPA: alternative ribosome rescue aminoacyl-tRNA hydrolase ArfB [Candidatus Bathyarchaeia archaeon]|nr:alternative ribosome rescue aminoacyl-tRNA hydrolase ArfB [Candidatus Bathyarchaeia archaeon]